MATDLPFGAAPGSGMVRVPSRRSRDLHAELLSGSYTGLAFTPLKSPSFGSYARTPAGVTIGSAAGDLGGVGSPIFSELGEVPRRELLRPGQRGQELRRKLLRGSKIVFVTAGYAGKRFILERAHALGVVVIVVDSTESWSHGLVAEGIVDHFIAVDMTDADSIPEQTMEGIAALEDEIGNVDGVVTFAELAIPMVARLADALGLPGNPLHAIEAARDKHKTRELMAAAKLPTPGFYKINSADDIAAAAAAVGFPAVIKPASGIASIGVLRVNDLEALQTGYRAVMKQMDAAIVTSGCMVVNQDEAAEQEAKENSKSWVNRTIIMEQYLDGAEVDVDIVMSDGEVTYAAVTDNWPTCEPYFLETGSNSPSTLAKDQQDQLRGLCVASCRALGLTTGVFHVEAKMTSHGPRLIEVNGRMGGGPVWKTNLNVWGVDLVEEHLFASLSIPTRPPKSKEPLMAMAEMSINAPFTGVIVDDSFMAAYEADADVLYAKPLVKVGDKVVGPDQGLPSWLGEIAVRKPTLEGAIAFIKELEEKFASLSPGEPGPIRLLQ